MRYKVCHVVAIFEKREDRMQASVFFISLNGKSSLFHCTLWIFRVISDEIKHCAFQKIALDVFDSPRFIDVKNNFSKSDVIYYFKDYYENLQNTLKLKKLFSLFSYSFLHSYNCIEAHSTNSNTHFIHPSHNHAFVFHTNVTIQRITSVV